MRRDGSESQSLAGTQCLGFGSVGAGVQPVPSYAAIGPRGSDTSPPAGSRDLGPSSTATDAKLASLGYGLGCHAVGHKKALGVVKHSIICACWHMLSTGELYNDLGGDYFRKRDPSAPPNALSPSSKRSDTTSHCRKRWQPERYFPLSLRARAAGPHGLMKMSHFAGIRRYFPVRRTRSENQLNRPRRRRADGRWQ
jgi:hypothetical protein